MPVPSAPLGILVSGSGSTYENLVNAGFAVAVVVASRPDCGAVLRAQRLGHQVVIASQPEAVAQALRLAGVRWVAMCGWLRYFDPPEDFAGRVVNVHPSLLPAFGGQGMYGARVHQAVLAHGVTVTGCTVHRVSGGYDSGRILAQAAVPVLPLDTVDTLAARVQAAERQLYPAALAAVMEQRFAPDGRLLLTTT